MLCMVLVDQYMTVGCISCPTKSGAISHQSVLDLGNNVITPLICSARDKTSNRCQLMRHSIHAQPAYWILIDSNAG